MIFLHYLVIANTKMFLHMTPLLLVQQWTTHYYDITKEKTEITTAIQ